MSNWDVEKYNLCYHCYDADDLSPYFDKWKICNVCDNDMSIEDKTWTISMQRMEDKMRRKND
tara:strand:- start:2089 stop:2274 length:186 start_codon:yes stop_codon:yes gene_type:complete